METEVVLASSTIVEVSLNSTTETEVLTNVANKLTDLIDVNSAGITTTAFNYVLVYDAPANEFKFVDPDAVLVAAAATTGQTSSPGLPEPFLGRLDEDLDDRIDIDAGTF
jgi:hypothetical protein